MAAVRSPHARWNCFDDLRLDGGSQEGLGRHEVADGSVRACGSSCCGSGPGRDGPPVGARARFGARPCCVERTVI